jgi:hypothetical protein
MKDFMFIFRGPAYEDLNLTPEESQASMQKWYDWIGELSAKGRYMGGDPLLKQGKMLQGNKPVVTDGPFIIKAESLEEAAQLAMGFPDFKISGSVEVREIMKIPMPS